MRIYARSPVLAFVSGAAGIIVQTSVVVQEIMAQVQLLLVVFGMLKIVCWSSRNP